jgi:FkbH-like protein
MDRNADQQRAFQLLNKTNQFNLNGLRLSEADWAGILADDKRSFVVKVHYSDRYGPLGNIAVIVGELDDGKTTVHHWVMSCRAFSRRIEHRCLWFLMERFDATEVLLRFQPTPRNGPLQEFLTALVGSPPSGDVVISRTFFEKNCPPLYHSVREN